MIRRSVATSTIGCLGAWISLTLPWWYISISGLGSLLKLSPLYLVSMGNSGKGGGFLQLTGGLYSLVIVAIAFTLIGGTAGVYGAYMKKRAFSLVGGILVISSINLLTYAFVYLKVAGAVLCQTPSLYGGPLGWGLTYGFLFAVISGALILLSALMDWQTKKE